MTKELRIYGCDKGAPTTIYFHLNIQGLIAKWLINRAQLKGKGEGDLPPNALFPSELILKWANKEVL